MESNYKEQNIKLLDLYSDKEFEFKITSIEYGKKRIGQGVNVYCKEITNNINFFFSVWAYDNFGLDSFGIDFKEQFLKQKDDYTKLIFKGSFSTTKTFFLKPKSINILP